MGLTTDTCCRCIPLKEGTTLLGFTSLVFSLFGIAFHAENLSPSGAIRQRDYFGNMTLPCNTNCQDDMLSWTSASTIPALVSDVLQFISALALVAGITVFQDKAGLLIFYPVWLILSILLDFTSWGLMVRALLIVVRDSFGKVVAAIVAKWLLVSFLKLHYFAVVTSYRRSVILKQKIDRVSPAPQTPPTHGVPNTQPLSTHAAVQVCAPNSVTYIYVPKPPEDQDPPPYEALFKPQ